MPYTQCPAHTLLYWILTTVRDSSDDELCSLPASKLLSGHRILSSSWRESLLLTGELVVYPPAVAEWICSGAQDHESSSAHSFHLVHHDGEGLAKIQM